MHDIHTTPGFIVGSRPYGEADKLLFIFTRNYGLVTVSARGIRQEVSKLRYHAQDYSFGVYSLVRGREFWRLTDAWKLAGNRGGSAEFLARVASLVRRLLHGEDAYPELFDCISACKEFLDKDGSAAHGSAGLGKEDMLTLESLTVARVLYRLGYIGDDKELGDCMQSDDVSTGLIKSLNKKRVILNRHINSALKESHL